MEQNNHTDYLGRDKDAAISALQAKCDRYESLLRTVHQMAKAGIFPDLPVETMGAQKCVEIDQAINEALSGDGEKEVEPDNRIALYETRLAMRMVLKVFKNIEKSPEQEKFYQQADYIFQKHHSVTDVLRANQKEDKQ
jgi:hypothetical protein